MGKKLHPARYHPLLDCTNRKSAGPVVDHGNLSGTQEVGETPLLLRGDVGGRVPSLFCRQECQDSSPADVRLVIKDSKQT